MNKKISIILSIVITILCISLYFCGYYIGINKSKSETIENIVVFDTTYNKIVLDSIKYNIIKKDSIVYNLKQEMKDEISKSLSISDSDAINLFKKLCTTD